MTRNGAVALGCTGLALVLLSLWLAHDLPTGPSEVTVTAPRPQPPGPVVAPSLHDLMVDLQIIPLDGQPAKPFTLPTLGGERLGLADLAGRPALLYFWATW